jgi:hypothetical protein
MMAKSLSLTKTPPLINSSIAPSPPQSSSVAFLQHVLPKRFIKVRYYGLLSHAHRQLLLKARQLLSPTTSKLKTQDVKPPGHCRC